MMYEKTKHFLVEIHMIHKKTDGILQNVPYVCNYANNQKAPLPEQGRGGFAKKERQKGTMCVGRL